ncbi:hypothetical protein [Desulfuribacillus alkaliarsenatis]|uniref:DUF5610 domain-containing protein n=1 Tax=Desulfuribacillus alkaliarsenatis TaxID=766136 RepID=A0A1E5G0T3_9FIRM|nr:hypothetical protein [Desulfuribacillus alkaliarsenatis]OEF96503.1 hypothetical protein BHF68_07560 [Desulfuribacillus alkaliarsenatis]
MNIPPVQASVQSYKPIEKDVSNKGKQANTSEKKAQATAAQAKQTPAAVYTPSNADGAKKATYDKPKSQADMVEPDYKTIDKLRAESEKAYSQLRNLVEKMLLKQGYTLEQLFGKEINSEYIEVDDETRAEAAALIADDGPLGAEAVSDRIVEFAIAISGGDTTKFEMLRGAIQAGFNEAERMLGGQLPDVSKKTHKLVMEKLDAWYQDSKTSIDA